MFPFFIQSVVILRLVYTSIGRGSCRRFLSNLLNPTLYQRRISPHDILERLSYRQILLRAIVSFLTMITTTAPTPRSHFLTAALIRVDCSWHPFVSELLRMSGECGHFLGPTSRSILSNFAVCHFVTSLRLAAFQL